MDVVHVFRQAWPYLVVALPGLYAVWRQWLAATRNARRDRTDLVRIAQEAAGEVIEDLRAENARVRDQLALIQREFEDFRRKHDSMIAGKDERIAFLEQRLQMSDGEVRQWRAIAETYERLLTANAIPHARPAQPIWEAKEAGLLLASETPETSQ